MQMSNLDVLSKLVYSNLPQTGGLGAEPPAAGGNGGLGAKPPAAGRFFYVFGKKSYFNPIGSHFARVHSIGVARGGGQGARPPPPPPQLKYHQ